MGTSFLKLFNIALPLAALSILIASCDQEKKLNTKEIVKEIHNREIKQVTPLEIMEKVNNEGQLTVSSIEKNWLDALTHGMENKGKEYTKKFCIVPFIPGYDTIAGSSVTIKKIGISALKHPEKLDKYEKEIFDAYEYNIEHKLPLQPNTQKDGEKYLLYTSPIFVKEKLCIECHSGNQGFTDFTMNGFAGMWSVKIQKKSIIQKIE